MKFNTLSLIVDKYEGSNFTFEQLINAVKRGYNLDQMSRLFNTTTGEIRRALIEFEIDVPNVNDKEVLDLHNSGIPTAVIADRLNITPLAVYYKLVKVGKIKNKAPRKLHPSSIDKEQFKKDIISGMTIGQLMDKYKKSMGSIYNFRRNYKISEPIQPETIIPVSNQELCDMYHKKKMTLDEIAKIFKVAKLTIVARLNAINCMRRSKREATKLQLQRKKST